MSDEPWDDHTLLALREARDARAVGAHASSRRPAKHTLAEPAEFLLSVLSIFRLTCGA